MVKKAIKEHRKLFISITVILAIFLIIYWAYFSDCGHHKLDHKFADDENGQVAQNFFPDFQSLPDSINVEFEHRRRFSLITWDCDYEGYYLKLNFESAEEYKCFLEKTKNDYSIITNEQRNRSSFKIDRTRFIVGNYLFRVIDVSQFGPLDTRFVGLIAYSNSENAIVFQYFRDIDSTTMRISMMETLFSYYSDVW